MYNKTLIAVFTLAVGWWQAVANSPSAKITASEWVNAVEALVAVVLVFALSNQTIGRYAKSIAAAGAAIVGWLWLIVQSDSNAVTSAEWVQLAIGLGAALGVYAVSNARTVNHTPA